MEVRRIGLANFGLNNIREGMPLAMLEARLLPLYLHHRYQLQAAVKTIGGVYYTYAVKTASGPNPARVTEIVPAARQREALDAVLDTIEPDQLVIPARILELIPPRAFGYEGGTTELFTKRTEPVFDPIASAAISADLAISGLLQHQRAARLVEFHARDRANPGLKDVVDALINRTWKTAATKDPYQAAVSRAVQSLAITRLIDLAANADAAPQVRATATEALRELGEYLKTPSLDALNTAHRRSTGDDIERFLARPDQPRKQSAPLPPPPGDPIGSPSRSN
jgi:hypothetical protein